VARRQRADLIDREAESAAEEAPPVVEEPVAVALEPAPAPAPAPGSEGARQPPAISGQASVLDMQRSAGNQATCRAIDALTVEEEETDDPQHIDQAIQRDPDGGAAPADAGAVAGAAPLAVPVNLKQIVTDWTPGPNKYGFQLKFHCASSSGSVADLQAQAPALTWREEVTYSRNDFAHRITPSNPTILPPGGVSFAAAKTTVIGPNELEFDGVTDTHWMPTSAVRQADFLPPATRSLPAVMQSEQKYQFSTDGATWTDFAGPFTLRREFAREIGPPLPGQEMYCSFTTEKVGIHTVKETYKP